MSRTQQSACVHPIRCAGRYLTGRVAHPAWGRSHRTIPNEVRLECAIPYFRDTNSVVFPRISSGNTGSPAHSCEPHRRAAEGARIPLVFPAVFGEEMKECTGSPHGSSSLTLGDRAGLPTSPRPFLKIRQSCHRVSRRSVIISIGFVAPRKGRGSRSHCSRKLRDASPLQVSKIEAGVNK